MRLLTVITFLFASLGWAASQSGPQTLFEMLAQAQTDPEYGKTQLTVQMVADYKKNFKKVFIVASDQHIPPHYSPILTASGEGYTGYLPADLEGDFLELAFQLVFDGYVKKETYNNFKSSFEELKNINTPNNLNNQQKKDFWWDKYEPIIDAFLIAGRNNPPSCAKEGVLSTLRKCCFDYLKMPFIKKTLPQCAGNNAACSSHLDCCSGVCERENDSVSGQCADPEAKLTGEACSNDDQCLSNFCDIAFGETNGVCASLQQCYSLTALNADCTGEYHPYCGDGVCYKIDKGSLGANLCKKNNNNCSSNADCCSDKCVSGKCVENAICKKCRGSGATPGPGEECCPGMYLAEMEGGIKKCRHLYNPNVPICLFKNGPCTENKQCCSGTCGGDNKCL